MPRRPDPLKELLDLQERMNRLFDETLSRESVDDMVPFAPSWVPHADVYDTPEQVRARHILVSVDRDASEEQVEEARRHAEELHERLVAGEDFAELVEVPHVASENRQLLREEMREVDLRLRAGCGAAGYETTSAVQTGHRIPEHGLADVLDDDVHTTAGHSPDLPSPARLVMVDRLVRSKLDGLRELLLAACSGDHTTPEVIRDLYSCGTDPAPSRQDENCLPGP